MNMQPAVETKAAFREDEKIYEIRHIAGGKVEEQKIHDVIELCNMLLSNITISEEGQKHLIGEGKTKGLIVENLFGMFSYFLKSATFDFISNVLGNITGLKEGRELIFEHKIFPKIVDMVRYDKVNHHRRRHLLDSIRNLAFDYES